MNRALIQVMHNLSNQDLLVTLKHQGYQEFPELPKLRDVAECQVLPGLATGEKEVQLE